MDTENTKASPRTGISAVPRGVWALGLVSMFMDISSEMIHSLLPVFLVGTLGASVALVGLIEGASEATASITKIFSGWLSDKLGKRKLLAVLGYGLGALSKPIFPLAVTPFEVFGARFADRIGKGVRGAPRDALVADLAPPSVRGAAFGVRQSLDTIGAFTGPLVAMALMLLLAGNIRAVFAWAVFPAIVAVLLLVFGVREPRSPSGAHSAARPPIRWAEVRGIGPAFWGVVALGVVFNMARFSEAFLVLRAQDAGLAIALLPVVMVVMNVVYSIVAAPAGSLSDRIDRRVLLIAGLACLFLADVILALGDGVASVLAGVALWGLHMGLTQGMLAALVVDTAPGHLRGTAFGLFNLASGVTMLAASILAGVLWSAFGYRATFLSGGLFAALALVGLVVLMRRMRRGRRPQ
ncbi:MAG: MFS transporter [Phenylobacterium sp.]|uniref:MFS transporter n=1 Tax=Phenylobacterium sp. TaxID=1871053 RepID=UPI0025E41CFD|nr:MFS transporter [Phenylobacterium sp.]MBT9470820.1 MFS transporter [Phenylobacterium sp.]